jgi:hypothetical protein
MNEKAFMKVQKHRYSNPCNDINPSLLVPSSYKERSGKKFNKVWHPGVYWW